MGVKKYLSAHEPRIISILASLILASLSIVALAQALNASDETILPPDLSQSTKTANKSQALAGETLTYDILVKNTGNEIAFASVTDTLITELSYVPGSLTVTGGGSNWGASNNVITWSNPINPGAEVKITFKATITEDAQPDDQIINTANVYLDDDPTPVATPNFLTTVVEKVIPDQRTGYYPLIYKGIPQVTLNAITRPNTNNEWTVSWSASDPGGVTRYELQEAQNPNFTNATAINMGTSTSQAFSHIDSFNNVYYYRVRAFAGTKAGSWSNVETAVADYDDDFEDSNSGWDVRRTNTNSDSDWELTYRSDDILQLIITDDNEYIVVSPLKPMPATLPVNIETEASFNGHDGGDIEDMHTFGIIFGAEWDGSSECDKDNNDNCFNQYYRLRFRFRKGSTVAYWEHRLDWVKEHTSSNNQVQENLIEWTDITQDVDTDSWNEIDVLIEEDGDIIIAVNDTPINRVNHDRIEDTGIEPYFGLEASVKDKDDARIKFKYFEIERVSTAQFMHWQ